MQQVIKRDVNQKVVKYGVKNIEHREMKMHRGLSQAGKKTVGSGLPCGPVGKNLPCNAGVSGGCSVVGLFATPWTLGPHGAPVGTSVHGIFQTKILEWVAISYSSTLLIST